MRSRMHLACVLMVGVCGRRVRFYAKEAGQSEDHPYLLSRHTPGLHDKLVQADEMGALSRSRYLRPANHGLESYEATEPTSR